MYCIKVHTTHRKSQKKSTNKIASNPKKSLIAPYYKQKSRKKEENRLRILKLGHYEKATKI